MSRAQDPWLLAIVLLLTLCAAVSDLRTGLIPNRLVLIGLAGALLTRVASALSYGGGAELGQTLLSGLLGLLAAAVVPLLLYAVRGIGGGDVKLLAVCGFGLGPLLGCELTLYAFSLGSLYAFVRLAYDGSLLWALRGSVARLANPLRPSAARLPAAAPGLTMFRFGPAIFAGALLATFSSWSSP